MTERMTLPDFTRQPVEAVDMSIDADLPLRILRAYRQNCDVHWAVEGVDEASRRIYDVMNEHQRQRAKILDAAIRTLEQKGADDANDT